MSISHWLQGAMRGGDAATNARLDAELTELFHGLAPGVQAGTVRSLAVTSAEPREGRTRVALYVAEILADDLAGRVLLVDADSARPSLHEVYGIDNEAGLAQVLREEVPLAAAIRSTLRENQDVLTIGDGGLDVGAVVSQQSIQRMLAEARSDYQVVVFDTGPLLSAQDALVYCHSVQAVVLVLLAGLTQGEIAAQAHRLLTRAQAKLLGVVINDPRGEFSRDER